MPDIEVPDPDDIKEKAGDRATRRIALFVAVYAVALAITALGGSNAGKDMVMAQQKATNQWAYYQAKAVRENLYTIEAEKLALELETRTGLTPDERKRLESLRDKYTAKAATYAAEKDDIKKEAEALEKERDTAGRRDPFFDFAEVLLQIAIVLASVAMLSGKPWAFYLSLGLAAFGALLCANGYMLVV
jgi:Domain of unknown function (DUF4337)